MPSNYDDAILSYATAAQIMSNSGEDSDAEADALWAVFKQAHLLVVKVDDGFSEVDASGLVVERPVFLTFLGLTDVLDSQRSQYEQALASASDQEAYKRDHPVQTVLLMGVLAVSDLRYAVCKATGADGTIKVIVVVSKDVDTSGLNQVLAAAKKYGVVDKGPVAKFCGERLKDVSEHLASMSLDGTPLHLIDVQPGWLVA